MFNSLSTRLNRAVVASILVLLATGAVVAVVFRGLEIEQGGKTLVILTSVVAGITITLGWLEGLRHLLDDEVEVAMASMSYDEAGRVEIIKSVDGLVERERICEEGQQFDLEEGQQFDLEEGQQLDLLVERPWYLQPRQTFSIAIRFVGRAIRSLGKTLWLSGLLRRVLSVAVWGAVAGAAGWLMSNRLDVWFPSS